MKNIKKKVLPLVVSGLVLSPVLAGSSQIFASDNNPTSVSETTQIDYKNVLNKALKVSELVLNTNEFKAIVGNKNSWLNVAYKRGIEVYNNPNSKVDDYKKASEEILLELNRGDIRPIYLKNNLKDLESFTEEPANNLDSQLKELVQIGHRIETHPDYQKLSSVKRDTLVTTTATAFSATFDKEESLYDDYIEMLRYLYSLDGVKEITDKVKGDVVYNDLLDYENQEQVTELIDLVSLTEKMFYYPDVTKVKLDELDKLQRQYYYSISDVGDIFGKDEYDRKLAYEGLSNSVRGLKEALNQSSVKPVYEKLKADTGFVIDKSKPYSSIMFLKDALNTNIIQTDAAISILENYPNTIAGKEKQIVRILKRADGLRQSAKEAIKNYTGEDINLEPIKLPKKYQKYWDMEEEIIPEKPVAEKGTKK